MRRIDWTSIETGSTGRGIPDSNGCVDGIEFWIEFKQTKHWRAGLRPEQVGWLLRRTRAGGRTFVAIRRASDELWLYRGDMAAHLVSRSLKDLRLQTLGLWHGGPGAWPWDEIEKCLKIPALSMGYKT